MCYFTSGFNTGKVFGGEPTSMCPHTFTPKPHFMSDLKRSMFYFTQAKFLLFHLSRDPVNLCEERSGFPSFSAFLFQSVLLDWVPALQLCAIYISYVFFHCIWYLAQAKIHSLFTGPRFIEPLLERTSRGGPIQVIQ